MTGEAAAMTGGSYDREEAMTGGGGAAMTGGCYDRGELWTGGSYNLHLLL